METSPTRFKGILFALACSAAGKFLVCVILASCTTDLILSPVLAAAPVRAPLLFFTLAKPLLSVHYITCSTVYFCLLNQLPTTACHSIYSVLHSLLSTLYLYSTHYYNLHSNTLTSVVHCRDQQGSVLRRGDGLECPGTVSTRHAQPLQSHQETGATVSQRQLNLHYRPRYSFHLSWDHVDSLPLVLFATITTVIARSRSLSLSLPPCQARVLNISATR